MKFAIWLSSVNLLISQTTDWDYFHSVLSGVGHFSTCEDNQHIRFAKSYLLFRSALFFNKAFDFKEMICTVLNFSTAEFTFDKGVSSIIKV